MDDQATSPEEQQTPVADNVASRDDLIAAVREAGGTESADVAAEAAAAGAPPPAAEPTEPPAEEEPRIAAILRAREKAQQEREAARNHAEEMIQRARAESDRLIQEARERAEREYQADLERRRQAFAQSPTEAVRALGNPQDVVDAVLREGTPEWRAYQKLQTELNETKKQANIAVDVKKQLDEFRAEQQRVALQAQIDQVKTRFLEVASKEKAPYLHARYDADEIFDKADRLASQWRAGGLELGKDFDFNDVAQYLELDAKKRITSSLPGVTPAQQASAGAAAKLPGNAPKVPANGPRTLSAAQGSERRTSPKPLHEMKPEEARAALIEEVAAARRANPDSVF